MHLKINDFGYLNEVYRNALAVWVNALFAESKIVLFDTWLADEQDSFGDAANEFWGYLTEADNCNLVDIYHHPDGPRILDIRRPNSLCRGTREQIELAMLYGHLQSIRYFAEGDHYTFTFQTKAVNPNSPNTWSCKAEQKWSSLQECRNAIDKILKLNPEHSVEITSVH